LRERFGFETFKDGQAEAIARILAGQNTLAIFPTGQGKSLCYQLPSLMVKRPIVVVCPLKALMKDQVDQAQKKGLKAERIDSTPESRARHAGILAAYRTGELQLLYASPERFSSPQFLETLRAHPPAFVAVDEAHCVAEWGHSFRPDYLRLSRRLQTLRVPILATTATANQKAGQEIADVFKIPPEGILRLNVVRPNLVVDVRLVDKDEKDGVLEALATGISGAVIVYATSRRSTEELAQHLRTLDLKAEAYHAGLPDGLREKVQNEFMGEDNRFVTATIAFGMGVDKRDVRGVFHYNISRSPEAYLQEIGRAGRDGGESRCTLVASPSDADVLRNFILARAPARENFDACLAAVAGETGPRIQDAEDLSDRYNVSKAFLDLLLTYLELNDNLETTSTFEIPKQCRKPEAAWLQALPPVERTRVEAFLKLGREAKKLVHFPTANIAEWKRWQQGDGRIQLLRIGEYSALDLKTKKMHVFDVVRPPSATEANALWDMFQTRIKADLEKLQQMWDFVQSPECLWVRLAACFGQDANFPGGRTTCGKCSVCQGRPIGPIRNPARDRPLVPSDLWPATWVLGHAKLRNKKPHDMACFLIGAATEELNRYRAYVAPGFGGIREYPFEMVIAACKAQYGALAARAAADAEQARLTGHRPDRPQAKSDSPMEPLTPAAQRLFNTLRMKRSELASSLNLPAYTIFHDATLREIATLRPKSKEDLQRIKGIGPAKEARYGDLLLEIVRNHE
jgi:ATP-dependent DNA helicase RecQ